MKKLLTAIKQFVCYLFWPQPTDKTRYDSLKSDNGSFEDLKKRVAEFIEMEQRSGSMEVMTPEYIARCMQISLDDAAEALKALKR